jgi:hypothetical protein
MHIVRAAAQPKTETRETRGYRKDRSTIRPKLGNVYRLVPGFLNPSRKVVTVVDALDRLRRARNRTRAGMFSQPHDNGWLWFTDAGQCSSLPDSAAGLPGAGHGTASAEHFCCVVFAH